MRKLLLCLSALVLSISVALAQQPKIERSVPFDEPEPGWNKLLQLKNGNTLFFHAARKEGIEVMVYDKSRKLIATETIEGQNWDANKLRSTPILGLYEINGEPVLFLQQADGREPVLYRVRINPNTGKLVKEEEVGRLPKISLFAGYAIAFGNADISEFIVEKDPNSDCYAVILFNGFAHDRDERIKVLHFDGMHKKINQAFYESPNGAYKYLRYIGAVVDGNKRVFVTTYASKGRWGQDGEDDARRVIVSRLNAGDKEFKHNLLNFSEDFKQTQSVMTFNHNTNQIQLLTLSYTKTKNHFFSSKSKDYYLSLLSFIDPEALSLINVKPVLANKVVSYAHEHIDPDYNFSGVPQQMVLNKDNTTTILMEEKQVVVNTNSKGQVTSVTTTLGPIGISELSDTGAEMTGYTINKKQMATGEIPNLYLSGRSKGVYEPLAYASSSKMKTNQFMSFDYINASKGRYVIFNDLPTNSDRDEDETKRKAVAKVSATNTMCFKLNSNGMDKSFLFGAPDKGESSFCFIQASDFKKETDTYATLIIERDGRDKQARVAWVTFE